MEQYPFVLTKFEKTAFIQTRATEIALTNNQKRSKLNFENDNLVNFKQACQEFEKGEICYNLHKKMSGGQERIFCGKTLQKQTTSLFFVRANPEYKIPGIETMDGRNSIPSEALRFSLTDAETL